MKRKQNKLFNETNKIMKPYHAPSIHLTTLKKIQVHKAENVTTQP